MSGSRLVVHRSVREELVQRLAEMGSKLAPSEPLDPKTKLGSMVDERQVAKVLGYVQLGQQEGGPAVDVPLAHVVSGREEARLIYLGLLSRVEVRGRALVIDIGGGSTEVAVGDAAGADVLE